MSLPTIAQEETLDTTIYNCDAEETISFIKKSVPAFYSPTAVPTSSEIKATYVEMQEENGDEACLAILTDGTFSQEWEALVKSIRESDFSLPTLDPDLGALYEMMKAAVEEQVANALETLGEDICEFMSKDNLEKLALKAIQHETGVRSRELAISAFADEIGDLVYDSADDDVQMLMSKDKMKKEVSNETRSELREIRRDLWDNL
jgi:hypothetical protein